MRSQIRSLPPLKRGGHIHWKQMSASQVSSAPDGTPYAMVPNKLSRAIIIERDGSHKSLSPEEETTRQRQLEQAIQEKMMGLPRTSAFDWHATAKKGPVPYSSS